MTNKFATLQNYLFPKILILFRQQNMQYKDTSLNNILSDPAVKCHTTPLCQANQIEKAKQAL